MNTINSEATPKTDAAVFPNVNWAGRKAQVVSADFARAQERTIAEVAGCFDAAFAEGWNDALAEGDIDRIRDLWNRRISFAYRATQS